MNKHLTLSSTTEFLRIPAESIACIISDGNYSTIYQADKETHLVQRQLGQIEACINAQLGPQASDFVRIGRSLIVNLNYIYHINMPQKRLTLSDAATFKYVIEASKNSLVALREILEGAKHADNQTPAPATP